MVRRYSLCLAFLIIYIPATFAQEGQSLGDIARKLRAQTSGAQAATASPANSSAVPTANTMKTAEQQTTPAVSAPAPIPSAMAAPEEAVMSDLTASVATDVHGIDKYKAAIRQMFQQEKFQEIDRLASETRSSKARFPGGYWKVHVIYLALAQPMAGIKASEPEWTRHLALMEQWKAAISQFNHGPDCPGGSI
jgi:hypothetical protein